MKQRRLYLHIGTEKTGTTSIQEMLFLNRARLAEEGYHFIASAGARNNRKLSAYAIREDRADEFLELNGIHTRSDRQRFETTFASDLREEIQALPDHIHTLIASSEHLHSRCLQREEVAKLRALLHPFCDDIRILVYLRPQIEVITSLYSTALKCGESEDLGTFVAQRCLPSNPYFNYRGLLDLWADSFGDAQMMVRLYQRQTLIEGDLLADFASTIGVDRLRPRLQRPAELNRSISAVGQVCFRILNARQATSMDDAGHRHIHERLSQFICDNLAGPGIRPPLELAERIEGDFAESNEDVRARWFPERAQLFDQPTERTDDDGLIDDHYVKLFEEMLTIALQLSERARLTEAMSPESPYPAGPECPDRIGEHLRYQSSR
ncbi:hypothetical protein [Thiorhodococcus fuscus]|uniref:Sulfotransferase family protein n=1 Tax=Thiorhodococcus fuscus TaxID=527200 RepID=A0ABW4Y7G0_9GAMM